MESFSLAASLFILLCLSVVGEPSTLVGHWVFVAANVRDEGSVFGFFIFEQTFRANDGFEHLNCCFAPQSVHFFDVELLFGLPELPFDFVPSF